MSAGNSRVVCSLAQQSAGVGGALLPLVRCGTAIRFGARWCSGIGCSPRVIV
jgi:hypothetical protein